MWLPTRMLCRRSSTLKKRKLSLYLQARQISWRSVKLQKWGKIATHDLAILRIIGRPLTTMTLGDANRVREGEVYAFTGFPIGMVLGLNVVTHRGIISAITPIVIAQLSGQLLEKKIISRLTARYKVFQLDATAYPGNSGSPLYHPDSGQVVGIINKASFRRPRKPSFKSQAGFLTPSLSIT